MNPKEILNSKLREAYPDVDFSLEVPKDKKFGDLSTNIALILSKVEKRNPLELANEIKSKILEGNLENIESVEVVNPGFINFKFDKNIYSNVLKDILSSKDKFGFNKILEGKTILIEHTSPNPNKEFHLGHLKNNVTGLSISYILEACGAKVFRDCIDNNRGIAIARLMYGYLAYAKKEDNLPTDLNYWFENKDKWFTPSEKGKSPGKFVDELYTKGSQDFKNDLKVEEFVRTLVIDWENEEPKNLSLWRLTQEWVWEGYRQSLGRVDGWKFDKIWHESDIYKKGKEHVLRGLELGIFKKLDDGAILTDLKQFKLPDTIVIKNDGTSLYITQDLELTSLKRKEFNPDQMFWVIGPEQSLAMKQMFAVCSQLGFGKYEDYHHIAYGFILVRDNEGNPTKMSSRAGNQYSVNDLIDKASEKIKGYITSDLTDEEKEDVSERLAVASIKYSLLKVNRLQDQVFDLNTSITLEGDSAPYILYSNTRILSVLNKGGFGDLNEKDFNELLNSLKFNNDIEIDILKQLAMFPDIVVNAYSSYAPNDIASYIYSLAQLFNHYYNEVNILKEEDIILKNSRLVLIKAINIVLENSLKLLGIESVGRM